METKGLQKLIDLFKSGDLSVKFSYKTVTKATKLMKKYAVATDTTNKELFELFKADKMEFWRRLNDYIADEYDEVTDTYSKTVLEIFGLIKEITGTDRKVEEIQFYELIEIVQNIVSAIGEEQKENFLPQEGTQSVSTTKQSNTTESEN